MRKLSLSIVFLATMLMTGCGGVYHGTVTLPSLYVQGQLLDSGDMPLPEKELTLSINRFVMTDDKVVKSTVITDRHGIFSQVFSSYEIEYGGAFLFPFFWTGLKPEDLLENRNFAISFPPLTEEHVFVLEGDKLALKGEEKGAGLSVPAAAIIRGEKSDKVFMFIRQERKP